MARDGIFCQRLLTASNNCLSHSTDWSWFDLLRQPYQAAGPNVSRRSVCQAVSLGLVFPYSDISLQPEILNF